MCGTAGKTWRRRPGACREPSCTSAWSPGSPGPGPLWGRDELTPPPGAAGPRVCSQHYPPPAPRGPLRSPYLRQRPGWQQLPHCCHLDPCQHQPWPCMGGLASCAWRPRAGSPRVAPACLPCARAGQQRPPHPVGTASSRDHGVFIGPVSTCVYFHYSFYFYRLFYKGFSLPCTSILYSKSLLRGCVRPGAPAAALPGATVSRGPARLPARGPARPRSPQPGAAGSRSGVSTLCGQRKSGKHEAKRPCHHPHTLRGAASGPPWGILAGQAGGSLPGHSVLSHVAASLLKIGRAHV